MTECPVVGVREIGWMLDVSRQRAAQLVHKHDFPAPIGEVGRNTLWWRTEVAEWNETCRNRFPGRPRGS